MKKSASIFYLIIFCTFSLIAGKLDYPERIKKEVALYPGGKVIQTSDMGGATLVILEISDALEIVFSYYKKNLVAKGWAIASEHKSNKHMSLILEKGTHNFMVDIGTDEAGRRMVNLTLSPPGSVPERKNKMKVKESSLDKKDNEENDRTVGIPIQSSSQVKIEQETEVKDSIVPPSLFKFKTVEANNKRLNGRPANYHVYIAEHEGRSYFAIDHGGFKIIDPYMDNVSLVGSGKYIKSNSEGEREVDSEGLKSYPKDKTSVKVTENGRIYNVQATWLKMVAEFVVKR